MDLQLQGKRALVTGSSSGIGAAVAAALAAEGVAVVVHGRRRESAQAVADAITKAGGRAALALGDLALDSGAGEVSAAAGRAFGGIDILVNNAGAFPQGPWLSGEPAHWNDLMNQNVTSMVRMAHLLVPAMKAAKWGRVINMASGVGTAPMKDMPAYSASKAANLNLTVSLSHALTGTGITVNAVSPGPILTEGLREMIQGLAKQAGWGDDPAVQERKFMQMGPEIPSDRLGRPEDIAAVVAFLCSPLASYVNGANIRVDGGWVPSVN